MIIRCINFLRILHYYLLYKYLLKNMIINIPIQFCALAIGYDGAILLANEVNRFIQKYYIKVLEFWSGVLTFSIFSCL